MLDSGSGHFYRAGGCWLRGLYRKNAAATTLYATLAQRCDSSDRLRRGHECRPANPLASGAYSAADGDYDDRLLFVVQPDVVSGTRTLHSRPATLCTQSTIVRAACDRFRARRTGYFAPVRGTVRRSSWGANCLSRRAWTFSAIGRASWLPSSGIKPNMVPDLPGGGI